MENDYILEFRGINKSFTGVKALKDISFQIRRGEVHALMGENGAGKSTLMKILAGVQQPSLGEMELNGNIVHFSSTREAAAHGIGMVHQELNLFENLSVAENIFLGRELQRGLTPINEAEQERQAAELLQRLDQPISPRELVGNLKVGQQQLVEIAKALAENADILILDEPTSALSKTEVDILFRVIRELTRQGVSIIYISHRLEELMAIGDVITILRDGKFQAEARVSEIDVPWIVREMLGSDPVSHFLPPNRRFGAPLLEVENLTCVNAAGNTVVDNVSFKAHAGEIIGIYGLMGAGRTELFECLLGTARHYFGKIWLDSKPVPQRLTTAERIRMGMSLVPEDRKRTGIFPISSVASNLTIASLWRRLQRGLTIANKEEEAVVASTIGNLSIKVSSPEVEIQALSGGNQQKVLLARCLEANPLLLIVDEPTRGVDVSARADIYQLLKSVAAQNVAVLMISSDLDEFVGLADRVLVMHQGRQSGELLRQAVTVDRMMTLAFGGQS